MATTKRSTNRPPAGALVAGDRDLMKALMKDALQEVLEAEMTELLGASPNERTETRSGYWAGYYGRGLVTRIGASAPARIRLPADDGLAIWFAKPGDVLPDGTIATPVATPLADAQPFEYTPDTLGGDTVDIAARGVRMTGNDPGGYRINPNGLDVDYFDSNGDLCAQHHESHGEAHGHNFDAGMRDDAHLPMSSINCR
ncbi:transposase [Paraburkholderia translucens]|uniref:transposase n=1 Tax=Paraburkholderia translucens TaxID=2886945 RepID=UPI003CE52131